jgi:hypothetical protein
MSREDVKVHFVHIFQQVTKDPLLELEVRFHRRFTKEERGKFHSDVQSVVFYELIENFKNGLIPNIYEMEETHTVDTTLQHHSQRLIQNLNDNSISLVHKTQENIPVFAQPIHVNSKGFKIALNKEIVTNDLEQCESFKALTKSQSQRNGGSAVVIRKKNRITFAQYIIDNQNQKIIIFRFDFTRVVQNDREMFEIEMEYLGNKHPKYTDYILKMISDITELFLNNLEQMLKWIQNAHVLMTWEEFNETFSHYKRLLQIPAHHTENLFRGTQPETLTRSTLHMIKENAYYIADKSDGSRALLMIGQNGNCYLISRSLQIIKLDCQLPALSNSIFDTEWFANQHRCLIFDLLCLRNKDVRNEITIDRVKRLNNIGELPFAFNGYKIDIKVLHFMPKNGYDTTIINKLLQTTNNNHLMDGIIFTPATEPYPQRQKWPNLLKWKPPTLNSIDLYVELYTSTRTGDKRWLLYVRTLEVIDKKTNRKAWMLQEHRNEMKIRYMDDNTETTKLKTDLNVFRSETVKMPFFMFPSLPVVISSTNTTTDSYSNLLQDKCIVEFIWNVENKQLIPIRTRHDKSVLGIEGSNFWTVAKETWKTMIDPITEKELLEQHSNSKNSRPERSERSERSEQSQHSLVKDSHSLKKESHSLEKESHSLEKESHSLVKVNTEPTEPTESTEQKSLTRKKMRNSPSPSLSKKSISRSLKKIRTDVVNDFDKTKTNECNGGSVVGVESVNDLMFKFHNMVKRKLVSNYKGVFSLLDLCTGKGGDIWKWCQTDIQCVFAIDNDRQLLNGETDGALSRWKSGYTKYPNTFIYFAESDARTPLYPYMLYKGLTFDFNVVSCFFAMHYLFDCKESLHQFLVNVQQNLTLNGHFIGCIMDGERVYESLSKTKDGIFKMSTQNDELVFKITRKYNDNKTQKFSTMYPFGQEIDVQIGESIISEYIDNIADKKEYLINFTQFIEMAKHYDLELVETHTFDDWYTQLGTPALSPEHKELSFLCRSFVFRKTTNSIMTQTTNSTKPSCESMNRLQKSQKSQLETNEIEFIDPKKILDYISVGDGGQAPTISTTFSTLNLPGANNTTIPKSDIHKSPMFVAQIDKQKYNDTMDHMKHIKRQKVLYYSREAWNEQMKKILL